MPRLYAIHPLAKLFPPMPDAEFDFLVEDIRAKGLKEPITLYQGKILDGVHRYRACWKLGIKPEFKTYTGDDPLGHVISENLAHRRLKDDQVAIIAARLVKKGRGRPTKKAGSAPITQEQAGNVFGVSFDAVKMARAIDSKNPELADDVLAGRISLNKAYEKVTSPGYEKLAGSLRDEHVEPPFSILDARGKDWRRRKDDWLKLNFQDKLGRPENLQGFSRTLGGKGTSEFDPRLAHVMYRWFCPAGGKILDPFSGGIRGFVAAVLGLDYFGYELSGEQHLANEEQALALWFDEQERLRANAPRVLPTWFGEDSRGMDLDTELHTPESFDFVFSCPPYGSLERYTNDPKDLSAMEWDAFLDAYRDIIRKSVVRLKQDRFAAFVVGEIRDKKPGTLRGLVPETIRAFEDAGARWYNNLVYLTNIGSAPQRVRRQWTNRKVVTTHQHVLVFAKGDPLKAAAAIEAATPQAMAVGRLKSPRRAASRA